MLVPDDRIKNISISEIVPNELLGNNDFMKITRARLIEKVAESIAQRLFLFDKVLIKKRKLEGRRETILSVSLDVIVPKGKPKE